MSKVIIRQKFNPDAEGDRASVTRTLRADERLYVEVEHTIDAREPTIMVAVDNAVKNFEENADVSGSEEEDNQEESDSEDGDQENSEDSGSGDDSR